MNPHLPLWEGSKGTEKKFVKTSVMEVTQKLKVKE